MTNNQLPVMHETNGPEARRNNTRNAARRLDTGRNYCQAISLAADMAEKAKQISAKRKADEMANCEKKAPPCGDIQMQQESKLTRSKAKKRRKRNKKSDEAESKQHKIRGVTDIAGRGHGSRSWLREVEGCCFCNKLKKVLPDGTKEATRCCAGKICKRGMHSTCWEERGGSPLPLDSHGKSVFWSCADLDAQIRPWKSYCKSLAEFPGVGPSS